jgi:hypothetical protein
MNASLSHSGHRADKGHQVAAIARCYCELIEAASSGRSGWLKQVSLLLRRLHAAMAVIHFNAPYVESLYPVDLDARFDLYSRLCCLLADRDGYFLEFDCAYDGLDARTGSLADDLTDIYCELWAGLSVHDQEPRRALEFWYFGYEHHWGQHLIDAERHLTMLAAANRLEDARGSD